MILALENDTTSMGTQIIAPFKPSGNFPLDIRTVVETVDDLSLIENPYDGLIVYVKELNTFYKYHNNEYEISLNKIHSISGTPTKSLGGIGDWALTDTGSLYHKELTNSGDIIWISKAIMGGGSSGPGGSLTIMHSFDSIESLNGNIHNAKDDDLAIINSSDSNNGALFRKTTVNGTSSWILIANITGPKGDKGEAGPSATMKINKVTTGEPDSEVTIENVGTDTELSLNISIPRGQRGLEGPKGDKGDPGLPTSVNNISSVNGNISMTLDNIPDGELRAIGKLIEDF